MPKPRIMFDHDGRHPLVYMYEPPMYKEEFEAAVDELAGTPVESVNLMLGDIDSLLYDTKVGGLWGDKTDVSVSHIWRRAHQNFRRLIDEGQDPLTVACDRAHEKGMLLYAQLLMQQGPRERSLRRWQEGDFAPDDQQRGLQPIEIGAAGGLDPEWPGYRCLDFKHDEVRDRTLAVIEEVLAGYAVDGLELEFFYKPYYFHPDLVESGREIMTEWVGRVHEAVKSSGPERELAVQVPASVDAGLSVGLDVLEWTRRGFVDAVIAQPSAVADPMADFRPFIEAARGTMTRVLPALRSRVASDRISEMTIEMMRAAASNYWAQGVDGIFVAHWFGKWPYGSDFYAMLRELPHPDVMGPKDKQYWVPTEPERPIPVIPPAEPSPLPAELQLDRPVAVELTVSDDLPRWDGMGRVHEVLMRIRLVQCTELDRISVRLNGEELPTDRLRKISNMYTMKAPRYRVTEAYWYVFRLEREHWPTQGSNTLEVTLLERDPEATPEVYLRDVELEIKYLQGNSFQRGFVDPDLGPYEHATT